jgi:hypothetical protein
MPGQEISIPREAPVAELLTNEKPLVDVVSKNKMEVPPITRLKELEPRLVEASGSPEQNRKTGTVVIMPSKT